MTRDDRELLELAAKAAGIAYIKPAEGYDGSLGLAAGSHPMQTHPWNPLADDGDALRLAVKLRMGISLPIHKTIKADVVVFTDSSVNVREEGDDPYAATRRAIVRAAAEIGRNMK